MAGYRWPVQAIQLSLKVGSSFRFVYGLRHSPDSGHFSEEQLSRWWRGVRSERRSPSGTLRILHINDAHHFHLGRRPAGALDQSWPPGDLPLFALARYLEEARAETSRTNGDLLYLSVGDEHTGTSLDELLGYTPEAFSASAAYSLQSLLGLDAAAIGNHDLDRGPRVLQEAIENSATFPVLSANISNSRYLSEHFAAAVGETHGGVSIGIIGVTTDEQLHVRSALDPDFTIEDPIKATTGWYRSLAPVTDVLIILSHLGINVTGSRHQSKQDDRVLARALGQTAVSFGKDRPLTLIIGGHTHTVIDPARLPIEIENVPIFQAGCNMDYVGDIRIDLGSGSLEGHLAPLRRDEAKARPKTRSARQIAETVGTLVSRLRESVLAPVARIEGAEAADINLTLEDRLSGECSLANMITDSLRRRCAGDSQGSVVVACDASGIQSGLTEETFADRTIRIDDLYRILPYADSIYRARLTPHQLLRVLESNALRRIPRERLETRGGDIGLMDWSKIARGFLHFSGNLHYRIVQRRSNALGEREGASGHDDAAAPKIADIYLDGRRLMEFPANHQITVYCNSFSAIGNQGWGAEDDASFREFGSVSLPSLGFEDTAEQFRAALIESLLEVGRVSISKDRRLRFEPAVGSTAFQS